MARYGPVRRDTVDVCVSSVLGINAQGPVDLIPTYRIRYQDCVYPSNADLDKLAQGAPPFASFKRCTSSRANSLVLSRLSPGTWLSSSVASRVESSSDALMTRTVERRGEPQRHSTVSRV